MRTLHTLPAFGIEASGPCYTVPKLCEALIASGVATTLAVLDWLPDIETPPYVQRFPLGWGPRRLGRSPAMARYLVESPRSAKAEIIHNHGLWMMPNVYAGWARKSGQCRLVGSPRGTLSQWALSHHRRRKRVFWWLLQAQALRRADAFHATSEEECADLRRLGFRQPVCVLPNGIDIPPLVEKPSGGRRKLLYLGRVHKKKGLDLLLRAWATAEQRFPDWDLVIAGPDDGGYRAEYQALAAQLGLRRVHFPGPLYGEDKLSAYRQASLYVLPTHSENFAVTVAEALATGTPAIVTKGAPWSGLVENGAGWWIEIGVEPLVAALDSALALPEERLREMGGNGRAWMEEKFSWQIIATQMTEFYAWLCGRGPRPECVRVD